MARATRSSTTHEQDKPLEHPTPSRKGASKKRKRNSNAENEESLPAKHHRTDPKDEDSPNPEDHSDDKKDVELPSSGEVPIQSTDAANMLAVLEMVDTQGLLDRVFPLPMDSAEGTSSGTSLTSTSPMVSLRSVLQSPARFPLSVLRAAVRHLHPISSHPRFRPSETAAQQVRFCDLVLSLLGQASRNTAPVPLHADTIIAKNETQEDGTVSTPSQTPSAGVRPRKYALMQRLPTGDWWTSASSRNRTADENENDQTTLYTANAELVSIFPSTSASRLANKGTLGDYVVKKMPGSVSHKPPPPRRVSCGKFLDYGPYASFAPSFDQDGVEIGHNQMGQIIFSQEMKKRLRSLAKGKRRAFLASEERSTEEIVMEVGAASESTPIAGPSEQNIDAEPESLLSSEEADAIKSVLGSLEMEQAVDELLQRNAKALTRLGELQMQRLRTQGRSSGAVEVGCEEWDVAQGILESLGVLASLRPRPSNGDPNHAPLIPPAFVLHKLQRTLPLEATEGWYGTLPSGRTTAFVDDTTVYVRAGGSSTSKPPPVPATPISKATTPAPPYNPYPYTGSYPASQYRGGYGTFAPGQGNGYYSNTAYNVSTPSQPTGTHYPSAQYGASGQFYPSWYANSGRSTPQPSLSGNYSSYFSSSAQPQRAVANTVLSSTKQPSYQPAAWNGAVAGGYAAANLPPHIRSAVGGAGTSGTPPPTTATATGAYSGYYGGYSAPR